MKNSTTDKPRKPRGKPFQKGHDPRRHKLTTEECQAGFWGALESIQRRYPDAVSGQMHMSCYFMNWATARK